VHAFGGEVLKFIGGPFLSKRSLKTPVLRNWPGKLIHLVDVLAMDQPKRSALAASAIR
jgi:hypothetical protein